MRPGKVRARYTAPPGYWFVPKAFGWGAVPVTWQGWAATLALIAAAIPIAWLSENRGHVYLVLLAPMILAFVWLTWAKTDGEWRWRWGLDD